MPTRHEYRGSQQRSTPDAVLTMHEHAAASVAAVEHPPDAFTQLCVTERSAVASWKMEELQTCAGQIGNGVERLITTVHNCGDSAGLQARDLLGAETASDSQSLGHRGVIQVARLKA